MNKNEIIENTESLKESFRRKIGDEPYQLRGIFTSEALLIVSIAKYLGVNLIVESGRARGYSTKLFAKFFADNKNLKIVSIDFDKNSEDTKYSESQLKNFENVELVYGDSKKLIPQYTNKDCIVFIDGPKGDEALLLAADVMRSQQVKAVCIHDLHRNTFHRDICEVIFTKTFFSDDLDFVNRFSDLDQDCWGKLKPHGEAPYVRKGKRIDSYASTVGVIFNNLEPADKRILQNYRQYYSDHDSLSLKKYVRDILTKHPHRSEPIFKLYRKLKRLWNKK